MAKTSRDVPKSDLNELNFEEIRNNLRERKAALVINQQILFKYAASLPPGKKIAVLIAGWGPVALFPFAPILYFYEWKLALFTIFLCIFWVGMGRKFAEAVIRKQCYEDSAFLKFAMGVKLVKLV